MTGETATRSGPLARFTVLDLTRVRAGPNAVKQLSDWGARVIKIESPGADDMTGARDGSDFQNLNRNKRSIALDLKRPQGVAVLHRLVRQADVLIENFRPDVKHRLGIDYEAMKAINPALVYASISGFGQKGPYRDRPGFDAIAQAMGGLMSITGEPGTGPLRTGIPVADLCSGLFCALGVMIALLDREVTGKGQWVQTSLLQAQIAMLDFQAASWLMDKKVPTQTGNHHTYTTPMGVFPASDGDMVIGASGQEQYKKFCQVIEAPEMISDPRFVTNDQRAAHRVEFIAEVSARTRRRAMRTWMELFNQAGIACGPIYSIDQVFGDPQVQTYEMVKSVRHPQLGEIDLLGSPILMSESESAIDCASPEKGDHTDEILRALGFTAGEIANLRQERAAF